MSFARYFRTALVGAGVTAACTGIGMIEGAISGTTGSLIRNIFGAVGDNVGDAGLAGMLGVGTLAVAEGMLIAALAINGYLGTAQDMENRGYKKPLKRFFGYIGYTANQTAGGVAGAALMLKIASYYGMPQFADTIADVALGAAITGIPITPLVTEATVRMVDMAYRATNAVEEIPLLRP